MPDVKEVSVRLKADNGQFKTSMKESEASAASLSKTTSKVLPPPPDQFSKFGKTAKGALGDAEGAASSLGLSTGMAGTLITGGMAAGGAAIVAFGQKSIATYQNVGTEVMKLQRFTGDTAEEASKLRFAAQQSAVGVDTLSVGLKRMSTNLMTAPQLFKDLGIATQDASGQALPMHDVLMKTADVFQRMPDGAEKTAAAVKLFGKSGADLIPFLNKGSAGISELEAKTGDYGQLLSGKNVADIKANKVAMRELQASVQGLQIQLGERLLPTMTKVATEGTSMVKVLSKAPDTFDKANKSTGGLSLGMLKAGLQAGPFTGAIVDAVDAIGMLGGGSKKTAVDVNALAQTTGQTKAAAQEWLDTQGRAGTTFKSTSDAVTQYTGDLNDGYQSTEEYTQASNDLAATLPTLADRQAEVNQHLDDAKGKLDAAGQSIHDYFDQISTGLDLESAYQASIDDLTDKIKENGATLDLNTQKGRDNQAAIEAVRDSIIDKSVQQAKDTGSVQAGIDAASLYSTSLYNQLIQLGFTKQGAHDYIAQLGLTPDKISTAIEQSGMQEAQNQATYYQKLLDNLNNRHITITFQASGDSFMNELGLLQRTGETTMPGHAKGGLLSEGFNMVNERGPEILEKRGSQVRVHTASQSASMLTGSAMSGGGTSTISGHTLHVTIQQTFGAGTDGRVTRQAARDSAAELRRLTASVSQS